MRIGIDLLPLQAEMAGVERYAQSLLQEWARIDRQNQFFLFLTAGNRKAFEQAGADNFHHIVYKIPAHLRPWRIFWEQVVLPFTARRLGLDLMFCPSNVAPLLAPCRLVVTVHDLHWFFFPELFGRAKWWYVTHFISLSARQADKVITDSQHSKEDIIRLLRLPPARIETVYPGVNPLFRPLRDEKRAAQVRHRYGIEGDFILAVGRLYRRKNIVRLLRAFHLLRRKENRPARLVLAGGRGDGYDEVLSTMRDLGLEREVILTGPVPDEELVILYNLASVSVYLSIYEGFGLPVLEALACGTPVVASNSSSLPEVCGEVALTVDPYDVEAIAAAIAQALSDEALHRRVRQEGPAWAGKFTWEEAARKMLAVFAQVCQSD